MNLRSLVPLFILSCLLVSGCKNDENYKRGYDAGVEQGKKNGYDNGYQDGYSKGNADGVTKTLSDNSSYVLFDSANPNMWKVFNWLSIFTIIISLIIVMFHAIDSERDHWRTVMAKSLIILLSLLFSYLVVPKVNLIWFFDPGVSSFGAVLLYIIAGAAVFFIGKFFVDLLQKKNSTWLEIFIIFVSSFFLWFIGYLLMNNKYLFGDRPLFGNNLIVCIAIGIISFLVYSLLKPVEKVGAVEEGL